MTIFYGGDYCAHPLRKREKAKQTSTKLEELWHEYEKKVEKVIGRPIAGPERYGVYWCYKNGVTPENVNI